MVRQELTTRRTALVLYGVLIVLPTLVLGALQWYQLARDQAFERDRLPIGVEDAARRLSAEMEASVDALIREEGTRPFFHYRDVYFPVGTLVADLAFIPSPLDTGPRPRGIQAWFSHEIRPHGDVPTVILGGGLQKEPGWEALAGDLRVALLDMLERDDHESYLRKIARYQKWRTEELSATTVAINLHPKEDVACLREELTELRKLETEPMTISVSAFHLRFWSEPDGTPRLVATRRVLIDSNKRLREVPTCVETLRWGATLVQGFFLDPAWYFNELPVAAAEAVLDPEYVFVPPGVRREESGDEIAWVAIPTIDLIGAETYDERDASRGTMEVGRNASRMDARFRRQTVRFVGVAAMLCISLATGLALLLRSVRRDLEQVDRNENFVAAVTHELRTPLAAIKLHGEMLMEGWVTDKDKQEEYYRRIVREAGRLETLVERVLEKGKITSDETPPAGGDLSRAVDAVRSSLVQTQIGDIGDDLEFDLADDLPQVMVQPDSVRSILINLVENARKYAPVNRIHPDSERILVVTRMLRGKVVLEVSDRGPGIPQSERAKIFEAFYRVGNEATRTASGTGLGLHLVALQMRAMKGRIQVLDREGGGTVFRLTFRKTEGSETDLDLFG